MSAPTDHVAIERVSKIDSLSLDRLRADFDDHDWKLESINEFLSDHDNFLILAKTAKRVVGVLIAHRLARLDSKRSHVLLYEIDVHSDFQQRRIASAMVQELKVLAQEAGAFEVWVVTNRSNEAAMQLYRTTGGVTKHDDDVVFEFTL